MIRPPRVYCGSCANLEAGLRVAPGERTARWRGWALGWRCPRCGGQGRLLDGWLSRWARPLLRLLVWGCIVVALIYCTKP